MTTTESRKRLFERSFDRRTFLSLAAAVPFSLRAFASPADSIRLGVASYSLRKFSRPEAISMIKQLGVKYVNIKSFHLPYESTPAELARGRAEFEQAGLTVVGGGTISLQKEDAADVRKHFEYAKMAGMPLMVVAPKPSTLSLIEKHVKEYDIKVAIHNHGPEDPFFPAPIDALKLIKNMDPRMGLCVDVGHTVRTGTDVVEAIAQAGSRLLDMHIKDLRDLSDKDSQCAVGEGKMPVREIFQQLARMNYSGYV